jgi:hypothetical protein
MPQFEVMPQLRVTHGRPYWNHGPLPASSVYGERPMHRVVLLIFAMNVLLAPASAIAQVQPGGTGGSVGKQDKSISGGGSPEDSGSAARKLKPHPSAAKQGNEGSGNAKGSSCGRIVGSWKWGPGFLVVIKNDGTAQHAGGGSGTWTCGDGRYVFVWSIGITDHVSLSADGNTIAGSNNFGTFSGTRF